MTIIDVVNEPTCHRNGRPTNWFPFITLCGIIVVFVFLELIIAIKTPAYESADEPGHVQNVETLVSGHWYGLNAPCQLNPRLGLLECSGNEAQQAPLYYLLFVGWQKVAGQPALPPFNQRHVTVNPAFFVGTSGIFLHHSDADLRFLLWLRIPNIAFGVITILIAFSAIRLTTADPWTPVVGASFIAFEPRMMFLWPFVTNDNLVNLLGALFAYVAVRYALAPNRWGMAALGSVFGLLVVTKLSTLPIGLVLIVLAFMVPGWKQRTGFLGIGVLTTLIGSGWYLIQNAVRYGDALALHATTHYQAMIGGLGQPDRLSDPLRFVFIQVPQRTVQTFWYVSGWNQFHWPWPVTTLFTIVLFCALLGLIGGRTDNRMLVTLGVISVAAFLCIWTVAIETYYQARYAYVGITAVAALMALGVERRKVPVRFVLPAMGFIGTLVALQQDVLSIHWN